MVRVGECYQIDARRRARGSSFQEEIRSGKEEDEFRKS
jgi:hypothetical protein